MISMVRRRKGCLLVALAGAILFIFPFLWREWVGWRVNDQLYSLEEAPSRRVAVVFGAAVYSNGRLSPMLRDRMETAIRLYEMGQVDKLLLSGDHSSLGYNEPAAMLNYAVARGVPREALQPDYGGRRTYDTCYRARHIFQVESAAIVTQSFHLPRAVFTCRTLGVESIGVSADLRSYHPRSLAWSENREVAALLRALVDLVVQQPAPVMGDPIPLY